MNGKFEIWNFKNVVDDFYKFAKQYLNLGQDCAIEFTEDETNANKLFGKTAQYCPECKKITIFITNRHPKDCLRSIAHELVHFRQDINGDLENAWDYDEIKPDYAQKNPKMRQLEKDANQTGSMMLRDYEDFIKYGSNYKESLMEMAEKRELRLLKKFKFII